MDTGAAPQIAALIGAASTITVTFLTTRQQRASFPASAVTSSAAQAIAWASAIFLYLIAINYIGGAVVIAINWNGADTDFGVVAFPVLVGGIFMVASIWATARILARWPSSGDKAAGLRLSPVQCDANVFSAFTIIRRVVERRRDQAALLVTAALHRGAVERH
jgi:hypothetical protein